MILTGVFAVVTGIATAVIARYAVVQSRLLGQTVKANERNAAAAETSNAQLKEATERAQRAYLSVKPQTEYPYSSAASNSEVTLRFTVTNNGRTTAHKVRSTGIAVKQSLSEHAGIEHPLPQVNPGVSLHPGASYEISVSRSGGGLITQDDLLSASMHGPTRAYVKGRVEYEDAFGAKHETGFCHYLVKGEASGLTTTTTGTYGKTIATRIDVQFETCDLHNKAT